jgi:hypothetical protein
MNPLLFLGREFLNKMTRPDVPAEEREAYRDALAVYSGSEEGAATPALLIRSFNDLKPDEYEGFTPDAMLWFVDWIASQEDPELAGLLRPAVFQNIFTAFEEPHVRLRVVEVAVQWEEARGLQPESSILRNIHEIAGEDRDLVMDALLFDGGEYARRVIDRLGA